jgi:CubicO group peptidase (beta-lactamase class C family)
LDLETDIKKYVPEFEVQSLEPYDKITIRQLLMHRSGLQGDDYRLFFDETKTQKDDLLPVLKESYLCSTPGTVYAYSNLAYGLLGIIIERLSETSFIDYVQENIFNPLELGMKILPTLELKEQHLNRISLGFTKKGKVKKTDLTTLISAGCSTYATPEDMAKFLRYFLNVETQTLLSKESMDLFLESAPDGMYLEGERSHQLGMAQNPIYYPDEVVGKTIGHGGATLYHMSTFILFPKLGIGLSVMCNTQDSNPIITKIGCKIIELYAESNELELTPINRAFSNPSKQPSSTYIDNIMVAMAGIKVPIRINKKGQLHAKLNILKAQVMVDDQDTYHLQPKGIAKLPMFKKALVNQRIIRKQVGSKNIYYLQTLNKYSYGLSMIGSSQLYIEDLNPYKELEGKYKQITTLPSDSNFTPSITITVKDKEIKAKMKIEGGSQTLILYPIKKDLFYNQGYGRHAHTKIPITRKENELFITVYGLTYQKQ